MDRWRRRPRSCVDAAEPLEGRVGEPSHVPGLADVGGDGVVEATRRRAAADEQQHASGYREQRARVPHLSRAARSVRFRILRRVHARRSDGTAAREGERYKLPLRQKRHVGLTRLPPSAPLNPRRRRGAMVAWRLRTAPADDHPACGSSNVRSCDRTAARDARSRYGPRTLGRARLVGEHALGGCLECRAHRMAAT